MMLPAVAGAGRKCDHCCGKWGNCPKEKVLVVYEWVNEKF
jgi:hypothetical protein